MLVEVVGDGTAAARAGVKAGTTSRVVAGEGYTLGGDLIVAVAGKRVASLEELRDVLADHKPGETVKLQVYRGSRQLTLDVTLGRQPACSSRATLARPRRSPRLSSGRCSSRSAPCACSSASAAA